MHNIKILLILIVNMALKKKLANITAISIVGLSTLGGIKIGSLIHERNNRIYERDHASLTNLVNEGQLAYQEQLKYIERKWGPNTYLGSVAPFLHWAVYGFLAGLGIYRFGRSIKNYKPIVEESNSKDSSDTESRNNDDYGGRTGMGAGGWGGY